MIFLKKKCLLLLACITLYANEILYFMPQENKQALNHLISLIHGAKENINISIYSFTNREIAKALRKSASRGVSVNIIYDKSSNYKNPSSTIGFLSKYKNIHTCLLEGQPSPNKKYNGLMHQKMAIIDRTVLIIGSANWSKSAFAQNYETLFMTSNPQSIRKALKNFSQMFSSCTPY
ncbi:phospholipase D-like domain-containing protein [Helicobacter pametensis]|uniref:phospholipase D-like domain-containing protein n=1 Tax=Helicobacter pametensis TaxID=95149 RepID=UPI0004BC30BA|nr:phospholipase D-like domain-containing protein [Helicobacter pametensis]